MSDDGRHVPIRSYRPLFRIERRIYRVERWQIPIPGGLPVRGVGYAVAALVVVLLLDRMPGIGDLLGAIPLPLRYVVLPIAIAILTTQVSPDGLTAPRWTWRVAAYLVSPRRRVAGRPAPMRGGREPGPVPIGVDHRSAELRPCRISGPAKVRFNRPMALQRRGSRWVARPARKGQRGDVALRVELLDGERLEVTR